MKVSDYKADGTARFTNVDSGYTAPRTISSYTGRVYLQMIPYGSLSSYLGTYAIKYQ
ncbi:MAG: hypothetical protein LBD37_08165 [Treponema sp.]|nr:hypothetical protein [Treponema sp.]